MFISVCLECYDGEKGDVTSVNRADEDDPICSSCGKPNYLVYTNRGFHTDGQYVLISASLAISPSQIRAHKKLFPDVGILPDGQLGFTSFRSHDNYLEATGFVKHPQKIKVKGKVVA